jgi:putative transcriptional regulator
MKIVTNLSLIMVKKKVRVKELARAIDITETNISILKNDRARGIRFSTLAGICNYLNCQPGDLLEYVYEESAEK